MNLTPPQINKAPRTAIAASKFSSGQIVLLIILIAFIVWYLVLPKYKAYGVRKGELATVKEDFAKLESTKAKIYQLNDQLKNQENQDALKLLDEAVPLESRATRIYILMESLVKTSGMSLGSMNVDPITSLATPGAAGSAQNPFATDRKLTTHTISINLTGNMQQFVGFLQILENNPRLFNITTVEIGGEQTDLLSFKVVVKAYAYSAN